MFDQAIQRQQEGPFTWAEPDDSRTLSRGLYTFRDVVRAGITDVRDNSAAYGELFRTAERQQRVTDNAFAQSRAQEEAYDRWIAKARDATGIQLENPERGGYHADASRMLRESRRNRRRSVIETGDDGGNELSDLPTFQRRIFEERLAQLRADHPDKADELNFGSIQEAGQVMAREADLQARRAQEAEVNPILGLGAQFAGALWAGRRDPLFMGSLFVGPTSAVGKTAVARMWSAGFRQGLFNMGVSALEQPTVQAWRADVGVRSGVMPALENVGMAFAFGLIPGAAIRGIHESLRKASPAAQRVVEGRPQPGDTDAVMRALSQVGDEADAALKLADDQVRGIRAGNQVIEADEALTPRPGRNVSPDLHDDLGAAALRRADDPLNTPSPEAVAILNSRPEPLAPTTKPPLPGEDIRIDVTPDGVSTYRTFVGDTEVTSARIRRDGPTVAHVSAIEVPPELQRQGVASRLYDRIERDLAQQGIELRPDEAMTDSAMAFWRARRPEAVAGYTKPEGSSFWQAPTGRARLPVRDIDAAIEQRIAEEQPQTRRDAEMIATEVIEEHGVKAENARIRQEIDARPLPEPPAGAFTTARGSTYELHADGTTTRTKAARADAGHEGDSGLKPRTERTVYVDDAQLASALSAAGLENLGSRGARVIIEDGKASLLTWNDAAGRWGRSAQSTDIPISDTPAVGKAPLELWKRANDVPGYEAYRGMHAGNAITELRSTPSRPARDPLEKIPWVTDDGSPTTITRGQLAKIGQRENEFATLVKACK